MANQRSTATALMITSAAQRAIERQWCSTEPPTMDESFDSIQSMVKTHLSRISHFKAYQNRTEFQEYFKLGQLLNSKPAMDGADWIRERPLSHTQILIATRIYHLFKDDEPALAQFQGVVPGDFSQVRRQHWENVMTQIV